MATDAAVTDPTAGDRVAGGDRGAGESTTSIYLASAEGGETGKSVVALGLLALLAATGGRVGGVFRPITRADGDNRDPLLDLLIDYDSVDVPYEDCLGVTYEQVHDDPPEAAIGRSSPGSMRWQPTAIAW